MTAAHGTLVQAGPGIAVLVAMGAAFVANGTLRLPGWARPRRQQMDGIAERLAAPTTDTPADGQTP